MKFPLLFLFFFLMCFSNAQAQEAALKPLDPMLENYEYSFQVQEQGQQLYLIK